MYIDTHVSVNLTVEQISEQACLSLFHFTRLFKIIYGISPYQYLREIWASDIDRAYGYDFEVYDERCRDWNNAEVDVFVTVP